MIEHAAPDVARLAAAIAIVVILALVALVAVARLRFGRTRPEHQVGAVPIRSTSEGDLEILLITTRGRGHWIVPKGWPMRGRSDADAAAREALEEAGVRGRVGAAPIGEFSYTKGRAARRRLRVTLYRLDVDGQARRWRERGQREIRWFPPLAAAAAVTSPELAAVIRTLDAAHRAERESL